MASKLLFEILNKTAAFPNSGMMREIEELVTKLDKRTELAFKYGRNFFQLTHEPLTLEGQMELMESGQYIDPEILLQRKTVWDKVKANMLVDNCIPSQEMESIMNDWMCNRITDDVRLTKILEVHGIKHTLEG